MRAVVKRWMMTLSVLVAVVIAPSARTAWAGQQAWGGADNDVIWAGVQTGSPESAGSWNGVPCSWRVETAYDSSTGTGSGGEISMNLDGVVYILYTRTCGSMWSSVWVPQMSAEQLGQQASVLVRSRLPAPLLQMAPKPSSAVVLVSTWFWADSTWWRPVSATAWIPTPTGVISATVTATPETITFATEDAVANTGITESVSCDGPGPDWNLGWGDDLESPCSYRYRHASTTQPSGWFEARVSVTWSISWTSNVGLGGQLPDVTLSLPISVRVQELHALVR